MKPRRYRYILAAAALLIPCFWRTHIYAGDLSSHIYNAWLATLIEKGQAPGVFFRTVHTNIIFDVLLEALFKGVGASWAERIAVSLTVLVLAGGAFVYMRTMGGKHAWALSPIVAMICYGWVFQMGFMNYLISVGFSLMALALLKRPSAGRVVGAAGLLAAAFSAHLFPVLWAISLAAYRFIYLRVKRRWSLLMLLASVGILFALHVFLMSHFMGKWSPIQFLSITGTDQFWLFGLFTVLFVPFMLIIWTALLVHVVKARSWLRVLLSYNAQAMIVSAAGACILPYYLLPPNYPWGFGFTPQRISIMVAILICTLLSATKPNVPELVLIGGVCCGYFVTVYITDGHLSRVEDTLTRMVDTLPPNSRVVSALHVPWRTNQLDHVLDRVCVLRCISYADYEPVTGQFRIETDGKSPMVAPSYDAFFDLQQGNYVPPPGSPDYYLIKSCPPEHWSLDVPLCMSYVNPDLPGSAGNGGSGDSKRNPQDQVEVPNH